MRVNTWTHIGFTDEAIALRNEVPVARTVAVASLDLRLKALKRQLRCSLSGHKRIDHLGDLLLVRRPRTIGGKDGKMESSVLSCKSSGMGH